MQTLKSPPVKTISNRIVMMVSFLMVNFFAMAQETKKVDIDINAGGDGGGNFFASPWVWVVGVAVFILLLVALLRGGGRREA